MPTITIEIPGLSDSLAGDLLTTAVEGGTNYWAAVSELQRTDDLTVTSCRFHEIDDETGDYVEEGKLVTLDDIRRAVLHIAEDKANVHKGYVATARGLLLDQHPNDVDYDADDADVYVQVALFGEVVYG